MKLYTYKNDCSAAKKAVAEDMILTKEIPTTAGSRMLDSYVSLLESEALSRLKDNGYALSGKACVGEFAIDLLGETCYDSDSCDGDVIKNASAEILKADECDCVLALDVNGACRRAAAQNGLVNIKPTYGTVSRFGTVPVACSGETVSVTARSSDECRDALYCIVGHDDKDGTSLPQTDCDKVKENKAEPKKLALLKSMTEALDESCRKSLDSFCDVMRASGVAVEEVEDDVICKSGAAWNILMCAELCNNVSRYDGVKYGYRAESFSSLDELYVNSRTEAFGELLKTAILFGSETLSTENYMKVYDKALRTRRVICERFAKLHESYDAVIIPTCSSLEYKKDADKHMAFEENRYTAPASVTGLPAVTVGTVQLVGAPFSEGVLLNAAKIYEKGVK